ncbi:MAG: GntR family transcriptional regulator [Acidobacteriota bacterium]
MIRFTLDKDSDLFFYEQIKGQLLSGLYAGKLQEGDRLPSIREVAADLGINYKTVQKIYQRLSQEEYVGIARGSGAYIRRRQEQGIAEMHRRAIFKLVTDSIEKARILGLNSERYARLIENYVSGNSNRPLRLAVVDHEEEAFIFSKELEKRLKVEAVPLTLESLLPPTPQTGEKIKRYDFLMTTSWHLHDLRTLAQQHKKPLLEITANPDMYAQILSQAKTHNVALVVRDETTMHASWDVFINILYPSTSKKFFVASIENEKLIEKILRDAEIIYVSPLIWDEMRRRTPAHIDLRTYDTFISDETIATIREIQLLG